MILLLAYLAGLLTLLNPCVLPLLPIVLASALQGHRAGPLALSAGLVTGFVVFGMAVALAGQSLGLTADRLAQAGAWIMVAAGLFLLVPRLSLRFETALAGIAARADRGAAGLDGTTPGGQFATGLLLGVVWSPCIGPTLGAAIALAYQGENLVQASMTMLAFGMGVATLMLLVAFGAQSLASQRLRHWARWARPAMGAALLLVGVAILTGAAQMIEGWLLELMPAWFQDFLVII